MNLSLALRDARTPEAIAFALARAFDLDPHAEHDIRAALDRMIEGIEEEAAETAREAGYSAGYRDAERDAEGEVEAAREDGQEEGYEEGRRDEKRAQARRRWLVEEEERHS